MARMSAVEEMAGMDILCSDKTGTLTLNELTVDKPNVLVTIPGMSVDEVRLLTTFSSWVKLFELTKGPDATTAAVCPRTGCCAWSCAETHSITQYKLEVVSLQALTLGALSANISSEEPIDMVMHESAPDHETLWDKYKQVGHGRCLLAWANGVAFRIWGAMAKGPLLSLLSERH